MDVKLNRIMKAKRTKSDILKKNLLDALEKSLGVITTACKKVDCHRSTFYEYYNSDENFRNEVDNISEMATDFVESQLYKRIQEGDTTSIIFFLKTKGKKRGYSEKIEIESTNLNFGIEDIKKISFKDITVNENDI